MATGTTVSIIPCGAMTADLTWLLLAPGRAIRRRQDKDLPAEWVDVPTHCVLVDTPDGKLLWDTSCPRDWEQRWAPTGLQDFFPYDKVSDDEYLDSRLKQLGLAPGDLDYVVLSHLHFDHAGNAQHVQGLRRPAGLQRQGEGVRVRLRWSLHRRAHQGRLRGPGLRDGLRRRGVPARGQLHPDSRGTPPAACPCGSTCPRPAR